MEQRLARVGGDGGGVDDRAAAAEMGERGLDEIEIGEDIRFKGGEKLLSGDVQDAPADELDGVVVDENVQLAVAPHRPLDGGAAAGGVAQVAGQQQAPPPELLDMGLRLGGVLLLAEVGDRPGPRPPSRRRRRRRARCRCRPR